MVMVYFSMIKSITNIQRNILSLAVIKGQLGYIEYLQELARIELEQRHISITVPRRNYN